MCLATVMVLVIDSATGNPDWLSGIDHRWAFFHSEPRHQTKAPSHGVWGLEPGYQAGSATQVLEVRPGLGHRRAEPSSRSQKHGGRLDKRGGSASIQPGRLARRMGLPQGQEGLNHPDTWLNLRFSLYYMLWHLEILFL